MLCSGSPSEPEQLFSKKYEAALEGEVVLDDHNVRLNRNGEPGDLQGGFLHPNEIADTNSGIVVSCEKGLKPVGLDFFLD